MDKSSPIENSVLKRVFTLEHDSLVQSPSVNHGIPSPEDFEKLTERYLHCLALNRQILAEAPIGLLLYDDSGQCLLASETAANILGATQKQLSEQNFRQNSSWHDFGLLEMVEEAIATGKVAQRELHYVNSSGNNLWLNIRATPLSHTSLPYLLLVIDDITQQKLTRTQLTLHKSQLEELIQARTADLQNAVLQLQKEIAERKRVEEQVQYHTTLLQNVTDAIIATDLDFRINVWNRGAEAIYGWQAEEVIGKSVDDVLHTKYVDSSLNVALEQFLEVGIWRGEVIQEHKDGSPIQVMASVSLVRDNNGKSVGAVAVNRDITSNKRAEDQLMTLSSAVEQSPVSIVITDTDGAIEYVNPKFTQITGYTLDEVKGRNPRILKSGETSADEYRNLWYTIKAGGQWQGQLHNRAKDGTLFWESASISPIVDRSGNTTHFVGIKEDITDRKRREREQSALLTLAMALRAANERSEMLPPILEQSARVVDATLAIIATYDAISGGLFVEATYREDEPFYDINIPIPPNKGISPVVLHSGKPFWSTEILAERNFLLSELVGNERAAGCLPLMAQGEPLGVLWVMRQKPFSGEECRLMSAVADMAAVALQRAKLHDKVTRYANDLEDEVTARTKELAAANERLQELDRLKSKFVSDVTHELRTPVTNIGLYLKLLEHKPEKLPEYIPILNGQAERLRTLVKDTLDLSRLEQYRQNLSLVPVDFNSLIGAVVAAHEARAESQNLALTFNASLGLPWVLGDSDKLTQVITNLVANALNYTPNGQVTVHTYIDNDKKCVCCEVKDTGCGIHLDDLPHLFDRFYRGKREQMAPVPGTGLGLSIVKEIVELHQGYVHVASEVGFGSTFTVSLPLAQHSVLN